LGRSRGGVSFKGKGAGSIPVSDDTESTSESILGRSAGLAIFRGVFMMVNAGDAGGKFEKIDEDSAWADMTSSIERIVYN
jgi:hypothetical protein